MLNKQKKKISSKESTDFNNRVTTAIALGLEALF